MASRKAEKGKNKDDDDFQALRKLQAQHLELQAANASSSAATTAPPPAANNTDTKNTKKHKGDR